MTKIEWTDEVWNPVTGCDKVSQGCKNCYAEIMHRRLMGMFPDKYSKPFLGNIELHEDELMKPLKWRNKPRRVFVNSMSDLFHEDVDYGFIYKVFAVMDVCRQYGHTFQILTKRPGRMLEFMKAHVSYTINSPLDNVWLGVSVEDQKTADERIPLLKHTSAAVRFLSCEPLLGPINDHLDTQKIHWVIVGGESGRHARPMYPDWVRSIRDQCRASDIPFFFKQWGEWAPSDLPMPFHSEPVFKVGKNKSGNHLDGNQHLEFPHIQKQKQQQPLRIFSPNPYMQQ
ncbi:MAG TPA: phage Gp37/Gp68 family protein [Chryseolinea sp.]|nr:phage Gp37/Gp68 family protein [Chryseolinea sp.]